VTSHLCATTIINMCTKFEVSSFTRCRRGPCVPKWVIVGVMGHSGSLAMSPFDRRHMIFYYSPVVTMSLSCTVFEILPRFCQNLKGSRDPGHARFDDSMSSVYYYSPCSMSVPTLKCLASSTPEIQRAQMYKRCHLGVRGHSKSSAMSLFDRPPITSLSQP